MHIPLCYATFRERVLQVATRTRLPGADRLMNRFAPRYSEPHPLQTKAFGLLYVADVSDFIDRAIYYLGAYAPGELSFLAHTALFLKSRRGSVNFFDVGANVGQHSLFMSRLVNRVDAFEPSPTALDRFRRNVQRNGITNICIHPVALGDEDKIATLGSGFPGNSGSRSLNWSLPLQPVSRVQVENGEAYFNRQRVPRVDLLKIDVEGYEKRVLEALRNRLEKDRPIIVMELVGEATKGGFAAAGDLRATLYPNHELRSLEEVRRGHRLRGFDWEIETVIVLPQELVRDFDGSLR